MRLTEFIHDLGRPVAFSPGLKKITGSTTATLLLCQLIYWEGKQADPNGWIYKTSVEVEEETGLSYEEQTTARKKLVSLGFIEEEYKRLDHVMAFRLDKPAIDAAWANLSKPEIPEQGNAQMGNKATPVSRTRQCPDGEQGNTGFPNKAFIDSLKESESTTEITTENTTKKKINSFSLENNLKAYLKEWSHPGLYVEHIEPLKVKLSDDLSVTILAKNESSRAWCEDRLSVTVEKFLSGLIGEEIDIKFSSK